MEARTKPNCGGILRAARAARRSGTLTVKENSSKHQHAGGGARSHLQRETEAFCRDPGRAPSGQDGAALGEEETVQHQERQPQGHQNHRRRGQDLPHGSTAHREHRRGKCHGE